jgi:hypothetical protein
MRRSLIFVYYAQKGRTHSGPGLGRNPMRQAFGSEGLDTPLSSAWIVRTRIVHVDKAAFQRLSTSPWPNILNHTGHISISENVVFDIVPFGTWGRLWIPLMDQMIAIKHLSVWFGEEGRYATPPRPNHGDNIRRTTTRHKWQLVQSRLASVLSGRQKELRIWHSFIVLIDR